MPYDESAAARAEETLAATSDEELIVGVRDGLAAVVEAQRTWRADAEYPARDEAMRALFDRVGDLVATAASALGEATDLRAAVAAVEPLLNAYLPASPEPAGAVYLAADRLRWLAIHRPSLVADARRLQGARYAGQRPHHLQFP